MLQRCSGDSHKSGSTIASLYAKQEEQQWPEIASEPKSVKRNARERAGPKDTEKRKQPLPKNNATTSAAGTLPTPFPPPT